MKRCGNTQFGVSGCRKIAVKRMQAGHMGDPELYEDFPCIEATVRVEIDVELCAYCASDLEEQYREENPAGFVREVPAE